MNRCALLLPLLALVLGTERVEGQAESDPRMEIGILGGYVNSKFAVSGTGDYNGIDFSIYHKAQQTIAVGLFLNRVIDNWGYGGELYYTETGIRDSRSDAFVKLRVLKVPLLVRYYIRATPGRTNAYLNFGPIFGLRLDHDAALSGAIAGPGNYFVSTHEYRKTDFGLTAGLGVVRGRFVASLRGDYGLIDLDKSSDFTVKPRSLLGLVGFRLRS